jgi:hypothetical protein
MTREGWLGDTPRRATGAREGWWGVGANAEAFLDQLVTWRELGFNFTSKRDDYDTFDSLPPWAIATLDAHTADDRPWVYDLDALEKASTHDPLWNAAQRQLVREGGMHNYLRMLWGKKILQWSATPREALDLAAKQATIDRTCRRTKKRQARRRDNRDSVVSLASQLRITPELAFYSWQQVFVDQPGQTHRDRINKDHLVSRTCKLAHEVSLGVRMVIPPIFTAKADYRAIDQHYAVASDSFGRATQRPETPNGRFR